MHPPTGERVGYPGGVAGKRSSVRELIAHSDIPAVFIDRGDIHVVQGLAPTRQLMPTTSCAMAATRVWAAETTPCRFLCASS